VTPLPVSLSMKYNVYRFNLFYKTMKYQAVRPSEEYFEARHRIAFYELMVAIYDLERELKTISPVFKLTKALEKGKTLLVGEGNLSFTLSLIKNSSVKPWDLTASTFEKELELSESAKENRKLLVSKGVRVLNGVDATNLSNKFGSKKFDNVVFQFPNVASRESVEGRNPNFILIRDFLISSKSQLHPYGKIYISAVDNKHYEGVFNFEEAAEIAGFKNQKKYSFYPAEFPEYQHIMTHQDESGIDNYNKFGTWVFEL
jgi:Domain of unknown function (DUF2431)